MQQLELQRNLLGLLLTLARPSWTRIVRMEVHPPAARPSALATWHPDHLFIPLQPCKKSSIGLYLCEPTMLTFVCATFSPIMIHERGLPWKMHVLSLVRRLDMRRALWRARARAHSHKPAAHTHPQALSAHMNARTRRPRVA